ncbi:alpha/beta hydrolase [Oryzobacter telluris]|uniref:alpha/beta hydrolase n=1 Tax=Oryzobacter telluris TaxID=3149179 RepID=UPI00370D1479
MQVADVDPIRDDGVRYAAALEAAGVPVRLTNYLRMPHGFAAMPGAAPALVRQQRWELVTALSAALNRA